MNTVQFSTHTPVTTQFSILKKIASSHRICNPWSNSVNWPSSKTPHQQNAPNGWNADASTFDCQRNTWTLSNGQQQSSNPFL